jgi:hypothetical protein
MKPRGRLATPQQVLRYSTGVTVRTAQAFSGALSEVFEVNAEEQAKALYSHMLEELALDWHAWDARDDGYTVAETKKVLSDMGA